jgi:hypothetical protein
MEKARMARVRHQRVLCLLLASGSLLVPGLSEGAVRRRVDVRYEREDYTKSKPVETEVTFMTGSELNEKTRSFRHKAFSNYALIWFDTDEVAVIELKAFIITSLDGFDADAFRNAFFVGTELKGEQVNSPGPRKWYFQAKRDFNWIDPRAEEH